MKFDLSIRGQLARAHEWLKLNGKSDSARKLAYIIAELDTSSECIEAISGVGSVWQHASDDATAISEFKVPASIAYGAQISIDVNGSRQVARVYSYSPHNGMAKCECPNGLVFITETSVIPEDRERFRMICNQLADDSQTDMRYSPAEVPQDSTAQ